MMFISMLSSEDRDVHVVDIITFSLM